MDELRALATEIDAACDAEREALRKLDIVGLASIADSKQRLGARLQAVMRGPNPPRGPEAAKLVADIRFRSELSRMLLTDAARTLRALVGGGEPATYDRSAGLRQADVARLDFDI